MQGSSKPGGAELYFQFQTQTGSCAFLIRTQDGIAFEKYFRIDDIKVLLLTGKRKKLDYHQFDSLQEEVRKLVTKKIRKISRVLHPDKCRLKQSPWVDSSRDALAFINKGTNRSVNP